MPTPKALYTSWVQSPFVCLQLPSATFKEVLVYLHSAVMPHLVDPRLLIDFLVDSYNTGEWVAISCPLFGMTCFLCAPVSLHNPLSVSCRWCSECAGFEWPLHSDT